MKLPSDEVAQLSVQNGLNMSKCVLLLQQNMRIFTVVMKVGI